MDIETAGEPHLPPKCDETILTFIACRFWKVNHGQVTDTDKRIDSACVSEGCQRA